MMRQAVAAGADLINDVRALQEPGAPGRVDSPPISMMLTPAAIIFST